MIRPPYQTYIQGVLYLMRSTYANFISLVQFFGLLLANANLANAIFFRNQKHIYIRYFTRVPSLEKNQSEFWHLRSKPALKISKCFFKFFQDFMRYIFRYNAGKKYFLNFSLIHFLKILLWYWNRIRVHITYLYFKVRMKMS